MKKLLALAALTTSFSSFAIEQCNGDGVLELATDLGKQTVVEALSTMPSKITVTATGAPEEVGVNSEGRNCAVEVKVNDGRTGAEYNSVLHYQVQDGGWDYEYYVEANYGLAMDIVEQDIDREYDL